MALWLQHHLADNNIAAGREWMQLSAEMGFPAAQLSMGRLETDPASIPGHVLIVNINVIRDRSILSELTSLALGQLNSQLALTLMSMSCLLHGLMYDAGSQGSLAAPRVSSHAMCVD
jgi:hypothetical protein